MSMVKNKPCKECPFKRNSMRGYLGDASYDPEGFLETIEHSPIPCHLVVNWENDSKDVVNKKAHTNTCIGSLQFHRNSLKIPRDPLYAKMVKVVDKNEKVFQWKHEFVKHHKAEE